jgi:hypothetical protein
MKREELSDHGKKMLARFEKEEGIKLEENQIDEFNQQLQEFENLSSNILEVDPLKYSKVLTEIQEMVVNVMKYISFYDKNPLTNEQLSKRIIINNLIHYKRVLRKHIVDLDDELDKEIGNEDRLKRKIELRSKIEKFKDANDVFAFNLEGEF